MFVGFYMQIVLQGLCEELTLCLVGERHPRADWRSGIWLLWGPVALLPKCSKMLRVSALPLLSILG